MFFGVDNAGIKSLKILILKILQLPLNHRRKKSFDL